MRAVIQRVSQASVAVEGEPVGQIAQGLLLLLGIETADTEAEADWLARKIVNMRIFGDEQGAMNLSLKDVGGGLLVISQFTLHAATKKGNRPSFIKAARPEQAEPLYRYFMGQCRAELGQAVQQGQFGADMKVSLLNDGPVTIFIDSQNRE